MRRILMIAVTAILATGAFLSATADAGNKNLHFGGPLGTFEATPHAKSSNSRQGNYSKKPSPDAAARRAAAKKAAARKVAREAAARKAAAAKQAAAAKRAAAERAAANSRPNGEATVSKSSSDVDETKAAPVKASAIAATNTLKFRPEPPPEDSAGDENPNATETADAAPDPECKKYIPSAGLTVSVPCATDP